MPKRAFALREKGPKVIELEWKGIWKNVQVRAHGETLGVIENQKALKAGQEFRMSDGKKLRVQLQTGMNAELQVSVDGRPLPGSGGDPETKLKLAAGVVYFLGGLAIVLGLVAELGGVSFLRNLGLGWISAGAGVVFVGLGYGTSKRSMIALGLACALVLVDTALLLMAYAPGGGGMGAIGMRIFFLITMFSGFGAIKALKEREGLKHAAEEF